MTNLETQQTYEPANLPATLPVLPLFDAVMYPKMVMPILVMEETSIQLVDEAMARDRIIGLLAAQNRPETGKVSASDLYGFGASALILKMAKTQDNKIQLIVQGLARFSVKRFVSEDPYLVAEVIHHEEKEPEDRETEALAANLMGVFIKIVELSPGLPKEIIGMAKSIAEPGSIADIVISTINSKIEEKQSVLEALDVKERLKAALRIATRQLEILELGQKIQKQVKGDMDKRQREYYLRQQLKAIKEELGETDDENIEIEEFRKKIEDAKLPQEAKKEAERELNRLSKMHPSSAEYTVAATYLDWITSLPWHKATTDSVDIKKAKSILDSDHFGLEKPKKRMIEYLAVQKLKPDSKGPILCFVGPPGTGKTSLGNSIARALGRKFVRISLGGVRDEAEIRGHRRTYVGALPGRIIQGLRRAGSKNPVFMLDEIDKLGSDFRGDPSSALLEVLDPEQNFSFQDHYLDVPFDLSGVMFITTANRIDTIPPALMDRMEVLDLPGYTEAEKIVIANRYLIPRQREAHGLNARQLKFSKGAVKLIISGYTREAGLRNLEREIAAICRGAASRIAQDQAESVSVTVKNISDFLGPVKILPATKLRRMIPGVAMGMAWTPSGGDILFVEAAAMQGKKNLLLTGQLGEVMKESAMAALSFIRSNIKTLKIDPTFFETHDIHIHVPAGAIPKDGPSAGVTMLTAIASLVTDKKVHEDLSMTGEITLRGDVLPVGGIKEKVLAAHRMGIHRIILPKWNEKDTIDIPANVKKDIRFYFVDKMMDVLKIAIEKKA